MSKNINLIVHSESEANHKYSLTTDSGNPLVIQTQNGLKYELYEPAIEAAPKKIITRRKGDDLEINIDGDEGGAIDVILKDYYDDDAGLIGLAEDGDYYSYFADDASGIIEVLELSEGITDFAMLGVPGKEGVAWLLPALGLVALGAAAGGGGGSGEANVIDTTPPTVELAPPSDSGVPGDNITNDDTPTIIGTGTPGDTITGTIGGVPFGPVTVDPDGEWTYTPPAGLPEGPAVVTIIAEDPAGNTTPGTPTTITIDTTPPVVDVDDIAFTNDKTPELTGTVDDPDAAVVVTVNGTDYPAVNNGDGTWTLADDVVAELADGDTPVDVSATDIAGNTGIGDGTVTVDTTPPSITVDAPDLTNDATPTITGTTDVADGTTVNLVVTDANGVTQTFTATATGGTYTADVPSDLPDGDYEVTATVTDPAGNSASATDDNGGAGNEIDTTPPAITVDAPDLTNDATPTITGTTDVADGTTVNLVVTDANGVTQTFTATATGGTYTADVPSDLPDGDYEVTATVTDPAGNSASATDDNGGAGNEIDTTPPAITVDAPDLTNDATPTITGTTDVADGTTVNLVVTDANGVTQTFTATATGGTYTADVPSDLPDGDYEVTATVTDPAGNSASATDDNGGAGNEIDTTAPTIADQTISYAENQVAGAVVGTLAANPDVATYEFETGGTTSADGFYTINNAGEISITAAGAASGVNDFETGTNTGDYNVVAEDAVGNPITITVTLNETDVDDTAPVFEDPSGNPVTDYTFTYAENSTDTDVLGTVQASDVDSANVTYSITTNENGYYAIDANTGEITLTPAGVAAYANDFELGDNAQVITVTASDGTNTTDITVNLNETDVDDTAPVFEDPSGNPVTDYTFTYAENSTDTDVLGTVQASDVDSANVTYSITTNENGYYEIDATSGEITLTPAGVAAYANDFEDGDNAQVITVTASDGTNTTDITVNLNETDVDDTAPVFEDPSGNPVTDYTFTYAENSADATVLGTVQASDVDSANVTYSITTNENGYYEIDATSGEITLTPAGVAAYANDFELGDNAQVITVTASDGTNTTDITVNLNETDVNDDAPVFEDPSGNPVTDYTFTYAENSADATVLGTVQASDPNSDPVTYSITTNENGYYEIDATSGEITLTPAGVAAYANDFELGDNAQVITVTASDGTNTTDITVNLNETDVDDTAPVFEDPSGNPVTDYTFTYAENSTDTDVLGTVQASDVDSANVTYSITTNENGYYAIDANTGEITLTPAGVAAYANDFELGDNAQVITVTASDGTNTTDITVNLNETDVDDTAPVFEDPSGNPVADYTFTYAENSADATVLGTVQASDVDSANVTYSITTNENGYYAIDANTGEITLTPAGVAAYANDFELGDNAQVITVTASDGTNTTDITVNLNETDVDDTAPVFEDPSGNPVTDYTFTYAENSTDTDVLGTVQASDVDSANVTYSITTNENGYYAIDANTGEITLTPAGVAAYANDFELGDNAQVITVTASDGTNTTDITVNLNETDVDDTAPVFEDPSGNPVTDYTFTYAENSTDTDVLGTVQASDVDSANVTYSITTNENGYYAIDANTGEITLTPAGVAAYANDFEDGDNAQVITVTASDGTNSTDITVNLNETDVDDTAPVFEDPSGNPVTDYTFTYAENSTDTDVLGTVQASDVDSANVTYSITTNENGYYAIDANTGEITLTPAGVAAYANDFELGDNAQVITVTASDGTNTTDITVNLNETDVDDTAPVFEDPSGNPVTDYTFTYAENSTDTDVLGTVQASDVDSANVTYSITTNENGYYAIDANTGEITLTPAGVAAYANDFELGDNAQVITVTASDGTNTTDITVNLNETDVDDTAPVFEDPSGNPVTDYTFTYAENSTDTDVLGTVQASDVDSANVTYSITTNENGYYAIDANTGEITLTPAGVAAYANDFELGDNAQVITVTASDGTNTTDITVNLNETDVDDTAPVFEDPSGNPVTDYTFTYAENSTDTDVLGTVQASDVDSANVTYSITTNENGYYAIDANTGEITLTPAGVAAYANDFEDGDNAQVITVTASDGTNSTDITVNLNETDVDDTAPVFEDPSGNPVTDYTFTYAENSTDTDVLGTVQASDVDSANVTYSITTNENGYYAIDANTGEITLTPAGVAAYANDFEDGDNAQVITVTASDGTNTTDITVNLNETDVDDTAPVFEDPSGNPVTDYTFTYAENSTDTDVLGTVQASDVDSANVTYSITTNENGYYAIDANTGEITLTPAGVAAYANDFELGDNAQVITVTASDGTNTTDITVNLNETDVDDTAPVFEDPSGNPVTDYTFTYAENSTDTDVLGTVQASDVDSANVTYSITTNENGYYAIDANTGEITLTPAGVAAYANDFELGDNAQVITVTASDGTNTTDITVNLNETDVDDTAPVFEDPSGNPVTDYTFTYAENSTDTDVLGTVQASDVDSANVTYSITTNENGYYAIDANTGEITLTPAGVAAYANDFELGDNAQVITVTASDGTNSTDITVNLNETDVDDTAPVFEDPSGNPVTDYTFTYAENSTDTDVLGTVQASDVDSANVTYSITTNENGYYAIDANTGEITLTPAGVAAYANDFEDGDNAQVITVTASDGTNSTDITVNLNETDVDDTAPVFEDPSGNPVTDYTFTYAENSTDTDVLGTVQASDVDSANVTYSITTNENGYYAIDANTGEITLTPAGVAAYANDFEDGDNAQVITVTASDGTNTTDITVNLNETDVDDTAPVFEDPSGNPVTDYTFTYAENSTDTDVLGTVQASDVDSANVTYSITTNENGYYAIDANTGEITLTPAGVAAYANDFEDGDNAQVITVTASDGTNTTDITVNLNETDVNEAPIAVADTNSISIPPRATFYYAENGGNVGTIDMTTGERTVIDDTNISFFDIALDSAGNLYGVAGSNLYTIDTNNGDTSVVGSGTAFNALVFAPDGTLYGATSGGWLYTVSTTDGTTTKIGEFGAGSAGDVVYMDGAVYLSSTNGTLIKYDLDTGDVSTAVDLPGTNFMNLGLESDGTIYTMSSTGIIYTIDLEAGTYTDTGVTSSGSDIYGLATDVLDLVFVTTTGDVTPGTGGQDSDPDGDTLDVIGVAAGTQASASGSVGTEVEGLYGSVVIAADGSYTYTLKPGTTATSGAQDIFTYTIDDGNGGEATTTLTIDVEPRPILEGDVLFTDNFEGSGDMEGWVQTSTTTSSEGTVSNDSGHWLRFEGVSSAEKTFDFGVENAGREVTVTFDSINANGGWDTGGIRGYDYFNVQADGVEKINTSNIGTGNTFTAIVQPDGTITLTIEANPDSYTEDLAIDNIVITANGTDWVQSPDLTVAQLVDGIVEGLYYETSSGLSGYTDADGNFDYLDDDVVTFKIGDVEVGFVDMNTIEDGKVFLQDIADVDRTDVNDEYVENMAVLLQSLDSDSSDNIVITQEMHDALSGKDFDLATISEEELVKIIEDMGLEAVSENDAMEHVQDMLEEYADMDESDFDERTDDADTLFFDADTVIDFNIYDSSSIAEIEVLDLTNASVVLDHLSVDDVLNITGDSSTTLKILGDSDDTVNLDGWTTSGQTTEDGIAYNVYDSGTTQIWVQTDIGHIAL